MARARKIHVQQDIVFRTRGGKRPGAGRKPAGPRRREPHTTRGAFSKKHPLHIVLRVVAGIGTLRKRDCYQALRRASFVVLGRPDFRICHISIQGTHVHLLVEADDKDALSRGMKSFEISAAKRLNRAISRRSGVPRRGGVFDDRYHREVIDNPRQARNCLAYVLNNWQKHGENARGPARNWKLDPYSTAMAFTGWAEQPPVWFAPPTYERMAVMVPETWLLAASWRLHSPISIHEVPSRPSGR
jgi:REP element-mobilizing transposase RayT